MKMLMFDVRKTEKEILKQLNLKDIDITYFEESLNENTVLTDEQYKETDIICVFIFSDLTKNVLSKFKNLRVIATRSTGFNHIDIDYCSYKNIAVLNVEKYGEKSVAEYSIGLIITLLRKILPASLDMKKHKLKMSEYEGQNLNNMTIGIIGCGSIGSSVAKIARFFGMNILIYSINKNKEIEEFCNFVSFDKLLNESDIITLHTPYTEENYHMIGENEFKKMKDNVIIINTARGELIDIKSLYENLKNGKVKAAGLDVLECELLNTDEVTDFISKSNSFCMETALIAQKLFEMENVIITPHIAYNTKESIKYLLEMSFNNIKDYVKGMNSNRVC